MCCGDTYLRLFRSDSGRQKKDGSAKGQEETGRATPHACFVVCVTSAWHRDVLEEDKGNGIGGETKKRL